jgi:hypothetical protein
MIHYSTAELIEGTALLVALGTQDFQCLREQSEDTKRIVRRTRQLVKDSAALLAKIRQFEIWYV